MSKKFTAIILLALLVLSGCNNKVDNIIETPVNTVIVETVVESKIETIVEDNSVDIYRFSIKTNIYKIDEYIDEALDVLDKYPNCTSEEKLKVVADMESIILLTTEIEKIKIPDTLTEEHLDLINNYCLNIIDFAKDLSQIIGYDKTEMIDLAIAHFREAALAKKDWLESMKK